MSRVAINTGSVANDGTGDNLRIAGGKINSNFSELYTFLGDGTDLTPVWSKTSAGINTISNVGVGTTNPRFSLEVGSVGSSGTSLYVNGNARVTGILTVGSSSIILDGYSNKITIGSGVTIDGNSGIVSASAFYAGGSIIGGGGGSGLNYWLKGATGITTTSNVGVATDSAPSALTVGGNSLFSGIATFRNNVTLSNLTSSSNTLRFGSNSYIDQSNSDAITFQINSGTDTSSSDSSFVFRTTKPGISPNPDQAYDALRVYSGGNHWDRLVRVYTNFHADNDAFVAGDLQVGAASTLIGLGNTLGTFKVGAGGTVITTTSSGFVGIGSADPTAKLTVVGDVSVDGLVAATQFLGDGSGLTGVTAVGSGVVILDSDVTVGTAATLNFGDNLTVSPVSAGVVTITGSSSGIAGIDTTGTSYFNQLSVSGVVTASSFVGDGSGLTGVVGSGSGVIIEDSGSPIGTAGTINFGDNITVSPVSAGVVTVTSSSSGIVGIDTTGTSYFNQLSISGVSTFAGAIDANGDLDVSGHTELDNVNVSGVSTLGVTTTTNLTSQQLNVSGVSTFSGNLRTNNSNIKLGDGTEGTGNQIKLGNGVSPDAFGDTSDFWIYHNPSYGNLFQDITGAGVEVWTSEFKVANPSNPSENVFYTIMNAGTELYYDRNKKFETLGAGVTVTGTTFTNQLNVSGVSTFTGTITAVDADFSGNVTIGGTLTYEDVTNIDSIGIVTARSGVRITTGGLVITSGVSTFTDSIDANGDLDVDGRTELDTTNISETLNVVGVSTFGGSVVVGGATTALLVDGDARVTGILTVGSGTVTIDGTNNTIGIGTVTLSEVKVSQLNDLTGDSSNFSGDVNVVGVVTAATVDATTVSIAGSVTASNFYGNGSGLTGITTSADSEKLSGQDPCFYVNYNNLYDYPEKIWNNVNQGGVGSGVTITGISTSYTFSSPRTVAGVSTDKLTVTGHIYYPTSTNVGPEVDVVLLYHGTITAAGVSPLDSAQTFIDLATTPSGLNLRDKILFSVAYPQDAIPVWVTEAESPSAEFPEFANVLDIDTFYFGDGLYHAEAALLWAKENLNSYLTSVGAGKSISRVYTFGHSQGAYMVHRLNTMHRVDGVISNAPGPIDLLDRCSGAQNTINYTCNKIRVGFGTTTADPDAYNSRSLKEYLTGTLSPQIFTQALDDDSYQVNLMQTVVEPGINTCTEYGPVEIKYYASGGHTAFASNPLVQEDVRNFVHSGITGSYSFSNIGIGTTNPTSVLTVKGDTSLETLNVSGGTSLETLNVSTASTFGGITAFTGGGGGAITIDSVDGIMSFADWQVGNANMIRMGEGNDLNIYHDGTKSIISDTGTGSLWIKSSQLDIISSGNDNMAEFVTDGAVNLYYDNSKKFETTPSGIEVTGLNVSGVSTFSADVNVGIDTSAGIILTSPNGTQYRLIVDNSGNLSTTAI